MVSIIITTYNYEHYIERAIRSCLEQSINEKEFEIIVVNDASTDNTIDVLANYGKKLRVFNLKQNKGLSGARNFGIKKAKGQYIVFLDADDFIHKDLLYVEKLFLDENNLLDAVSCDYFKVNDRGARIEYVDAEETPIACGIMFRKDFLYSIGLYDEGFKAREEEDLRIRWVKRYNIHNLKIPLYRYRMHGTNLTKDTKKMDTYLTVLNKKHK